MNSIEFLAIRKLQKEREATDFEAAQFLDQVNAGTSTHDAALEMAMVEVADDSYRPEGAPAPPVDEVASRPGDWAKDLAAPDNGTGDPRAGSPIGIVRDHPSHDEDTSTKHLIIWALLPLAKLPDTVATLVKDAVHGDLDEQCRAALAAGDAIARRRREPDADIPF